MVSNHGVPVWPPSGPSLAVPWARIYSLWSKTPTSTRSTRQSATRVWSYGRLKFRPRVPYIWYFFPPQNAPFAPIPGSLWWALSVHFQEWLVSAILEMVSAILKLVSAILKLVSAILNLVLSIALAGSFDGRFLSISEIIGFLSRTRSQNGFRHTQIGFLYSNWVATTSDFLVWAMWDFESTFWVDFRCRPVPFFLRSRVSSILQKLFYRLKVLALTLDALASQTSSLKLVLKMKKSKMGPISRSAEIAFCPAGWPMLLCDELCRWASEKTWANVPATLP